MHDLCPITVSKSVDVQTPRACGPWKHTDRKNPEYLNGKGNEIHDPDVPQKMLKLPKPKPFAFDSAT